MNLVTVTHTEFNIFFKYLREKGSEITSIEIFLVYCSSKQWKTDEKRF